MISNWYIIFKQAELNKKTNLHTQCKLSHWLLVNNQTDKKRKSSREINKMLNKLDLETEHCIQQWQNTHRYETPNNYLTKLTIKQDLKQISVIFKGWNYIVYIFSEHSENKLETSNYKIINIVKCLEIKKHISNNKWARGEITMETRQCFELNDNEAAKAVFRQKFPCLGALWKKPERNQCSNHSFQGAWRKRAN